MLLESGYRLIRSSDNAVIQTWGGVPGQSPAIPNVIDVPTTFFVKLEPNDKGEAIVEERQGFAYIHCPQIGVEYEGHRLEVWMMERPAVTTFDGATFLGRVTDEEYLKIISAATSNIQLCRWLDIFRLRGEIDVTGTTSLAAKAGLVALGLLTQERADIIFATA